VVKRFLEETEFEAVALIVSSASFKEGLEHVKSDVVLILTCRGKFSGILLVCFREFVDVLTSIVCCLSELEFCFQVVKAIDAGGTNAGLDELKPEHMKGIVWLHAQMKCLAELLVEALEDKLACCLVVDLVVRVVLGSERGSSCTCSVRCVLRVLGEHTAHSLGVRWTWKVSNDVDTTVYHMFLHLTNERC
jgi:hypothetical protein